MYYLTVFRHFASILSLIFDSLVLDLFDRSFLQTRRYDWVHVYHVLNPLIPNTWGSSPPPPVYNTPKSTIHLWDNVSHMWHISKCVWFCSKSCSSCSTTTYNKPLIFHVFSHIYPDARHNHTDIDVYVFYTYCALLVFWPPPPSPVYVVDPVLLYSFSLCGSIPQCAAVT